MEIAVARRTNIIALAAALATGIVLMFGAATSQAKHSQGEVSVGLVQVNGGADDIGVSPNADSNDRADDIGVAPEATSNNNAGDIGDAPEADAGRDAGDVSIAPR
jgi:hypothetical protein